MFLRASTRHSNVPWLFAAATMLPSLITVRDLTAVSISGTCSQVNNRFNRNPFKGNSLWIRSVNSREYIKQHLKIHHLTISYMYLPTHSCKNLQSDRTPVRFHLSPDINSLSQMKKCTLRNFSSWQGQIWFAAWNHYDRYRNCSSFRKKGGFARSKY